jgi:hydrogenase expression/formation protein HypC
MCLAVPGKVIKRRGDEAVVDMLGNQLRVSTVLTPDVQPGGWVLVHAGFCISELDEQAALETWDYLRQALGETPIAADPASTPAP